MKQGDLIDCFYCTVGREISCVDKWLAEPVELYPLMPRHLSCSDRDFQWRRREVANRLAGEFYIVTDDDCAPIGKVVEHGVDILTRHPEFTILSLWPDNAHIVPWTPEGYQPLSDADEVMEHVSVGGVRFCRKMPFTVWPPMPEGGYHGYDALHCQAIRDAGFRVGYFRNLKMHHLGEGHTTLLEAA